jgi:diguanylate cyclase (GGDEF)-like protein
LRTTIYIEPMIKDLKPSAIPGVPSILDDEQEATKTTSQESVKPAVPRHEKPCLIVLNGNNAGEAYPIPPEQTVIGRGFDSAVRLVDDGISRAHARIEHTPAGTYIEDLGSANGTHVNGERVVERRLLTDGDKVRLGSTTILKFTYHDDIESDFLTRMFESARRDYLTRTFSKQYLLTRLATEFAYAWRHGAPLSVLMIDIDHFKRVNDTYGHPAGDRVLVRIGATLSAVVRTEDMVARYGGEEFTVVCRGIDLRQSRALAERLRGCVEAIRMEETASVMPLTISVGVATFPADGIDSAEDLVAAADRALYRAKTGGRNRVEV